MEGRPSATGGILKFKRIPHYLLFVSLLVMASIISVQGVSASSHALAYSTPSTALQRYTAVCPASRAVHCDAYVFTGTQRKPLARPRIAGPVAGSYGPA